MTLKDVIASKPARIITCRKDTRLSDTVTQMEENNVGSVLVVDEEEELVGIFTERDIMHCFANKISLNDEVMAAVMTSKPISLDVSIDISVAVSVMSEKKIRHLPVTENGRIVGIISYRDLISYLLPEILFLADDI